MTTFLLTVNNEPHSIDVDPQTPLLWVLRDIVGLTGTKYSCGKGLCGACTVHLDGVAVPACQTTIAEAADREVTTIEGLSSERDHPVQRAWMAENVSQCGYCQPGQIMTAAALLARNPSPSQTEIDAAMSPVLCRCGTYLRIRTAIQRAIEEG